MAESFERLNKPGQTAGTSGWSVGRFDWLNDPASKVNRYWRVIEQGSSATKWPWQGETIVGLWGPNAGPRGELHKGDLDAFQTGRADQKFVPFFRQRGSDMTRAARAALWYYFDGGKGPNMEQLTPDATRSRHEGGHFNADAERHRIFFWLMTRAKLDQMPFVSGVVVRPIPPALFYQRALASFDPLGKEIEALRAGVQHLAGANVSTPSGLATAREALAVDTGSYQGVQRSLSPGQAIGLRPAARTGAPRQFVTHAPVPVSMATATLSAASQDFLRDGKGRFSSGAWQDMLRKVNRDVAKQYQDAVVSLMNAERKRPPTGDLIKATKAPQNRYPQ